MAIGDLVHEVAEVGRSHAGVSAELVHLVGCRLDEHGCAVVERLQHGGFEYQRVGGANRGDTDGVAGLVTQDGVQQEVAHDAPFGV